MKHWPKNVDAKILITYKRYLKVEFLIINISSLHINEWENAQRKYLNVNWQESLQIHKAKFSGLFYNSLVNP